MACDQFNSFLIGSHPLSVLFATRLYQEGQKIGFVEDMSNSWSGQYLQEMGGLERSLLITWGMDQSIDVLKEIDNYLCHNTISFILDGTHLLLGRKPWQNLVELARKLPGLFSEQSMRQINQVQESQELQNLFDERFESLTGRIALNCFRYRTLETLTATIFETHCPENVRNLFRDFYTNIFKDEFSTFLYSTRAFYHENMSVHMGDLEAFHLLISLLSPLYKVDNKKLFKDLKKTYQNMGDFFQCDYFPRLNVRGRKISEINLQKQQSKKPIQSDKFFFFGASRLDSNVLLNSKDTLYRSYSVEVPKQKVELKGWRKGIFYVSAIKLLATDMPFLIIDNTHSNCLHLNICVEEKQGMNFRTVYRRVEEFLIQQMAGLGIHIDREDLKDIQQGASYMPIEWHAKAKRTLACRLPLDNEVSYLKNMNSRVKLKNAFGFGPSRHEPLGLFSLLMQLKHIDMYVLH